MRVHVVDGGEAGQIVDCAEARNADLITMTMHGHAVAPELALGRVARRVLQAAPCPVLTVGPQVTGELPPLGAPPG